MMNEKQSSKTSSKLSIVFMGSGPVAAESLRLLGQDFDIEAVVTKPTTKSEMLMFTSEDKLFTVSSKSELDALIERKKFSSKVCVLIDFGIIVSQKTIDYFPKGIVNSHFSVLPQLRGADPISFAILEGKNETGVSLMLLVEAMDEGPIISLGKHPLDHSETGPELTEALVQLSYSLLKDTLPAYVNETVHAPSGVVPVPRPQEVVCKMLDMPFEPSYTRKLTKNDGIIDWSKDAAQIEREIRAFIDWPKSRTTLDSIDCVVTKSSILSGVSGKPSELFIHDKKLAVYCGKDSLIIEKIKPPGKKEMGSQSFLAGYRNRLSV